MLALLYGQVTNPAKRTALPVPCLYQRRQDGLAGPRLETAGKGPLFDRHGRLMKVLGFTVTGSDTRERYAAASNTSSRNI